MLPCNLTKVMSHDWRSNYHSSNGHSVKLCYMLLWCWQSNGHIWTFRKTLSHVFMILMIQQPYIVDFRYYRKLSWHTRTCKVWYSFFVAFTHKMMIQQNVSLVWGFAQAPRKNTTWHVQSPKSFLVLKTLIYSKCIIL